MGKVEIKIRKKILTPDNLQKYRNYPALLKKYERNKRFKRALRIFIYSLALTIFVLALIFLGMWKIMLDKNQESSSLLKYVEITDNNQDTTLIRIKRKNLTDSLHTISIERGEDVTLDTFDFPARKAFNRLSDIQFLSEKKIHLDTRDITVVKYTFGRGDLNIRSFYYYSVDFGIMIFYYSGSSHLGYTHQELTLTETGNPQKDSVLPLLIQKIKADTAFYKNNFY